MNSPLFMPGMRMPDVVKAYEVDLPEDEPVIGVSAGGKHRAYRVKAMVRITDHVINDLLDEVPVTVTYDERNNRAQVFTCDARGRPMDIEMGGYFNGMLIRVDRRRMVRQESGRYLSRPGTEGEQALTTMPFTRTDWKTWRTTFPETDAFVGQ
jgi:hypothetical protein